MTEEKPEKEIADGKNNLNLLQYAGLGMQMLALIGIFIGLGITLDNYIRPNKPWFLLAFSLVGCILGMVFVINRFATKK